jgi:DNA-binding transcriptional LysR family regulator
MVNLEQLRYALVLESQGNFTRAANELHISQPTLTRNIQALEQHIGARLFIRSRSHIVPTEIGVSFLREAESILQQVRMLESRVAQDKGVLVGEVVIGTSTYPEELYIADVLAKIIEELPNIDVKINCGSPVNFIKKLYSEEIDFFIGEKGYLEHDRYLHSVPLKNNDRGYFFCRTGHPLLKQDYVNLEDLVKYPLVGNHLPTRIYSQLPRSQTFGEQQGFLLKPKIFCHSFHLQKKTVMQSNGIGLGAESSIKPEIDQGKLSILRFQQLDLKTDYGITYLSSRKLSQIDKAIIDIVLDVDRKRGIKNQSNA